MFTRRLRNLLTAPAPAPRPLLPPPQDNRLELNSVHRASDLASDDTTGKVALHHAANYNVDSPVAVPAAACRPLEGFNLAAEGIELDVISPLAEQMLLRESTSFINLVPLAPPPPAHLPNGGDDIEVAPAPVDGMREIPIIHPSVVTQVQVNHDFDHRFGFGYEDTISIPDLSIALDSSPFTDDEEVEEEEENPQVDAASTLSGRPISDPFVDPGTARAQRRRGFHGVENVPVESTSLDITEISTIDENSNSATKIHPQGEYYFEDDSTLTRNHPSSQFLEFSTLPPQSPHNTTQDVRDDLEIHHISPQNMDIPLPREERRRRIVEGYTKNRMGLHCLDSCVVYNRGMTMRIPTDRAKFTKGWYFHMIPVYQALFALAILANGLSLALVLVVAARKHALAENPPYSKLLTGFAANLYIASQVRQDIFVNLLYKAAWLVPRSRPLWFRAMIARIYENGGVHSGCAFSAMCWFVTITTFLIIQLAKGAFHLVAPVALSNIILSTLITMATTAIPKLRQLDHNNFEYIHRFGAWIVLILGWALLITLAMIQRDMEGMTLSSVIFKSPATWFLIASTLIAIWPWIFLRRLRVTSVRFSRHAVQLFFTMPIDLNKGIRLSESPLGDYHSFASIPNRDGGRSGGSVIISSAGDWTKRTIMNPRKYYWVKGVPVTGFLCVAGLFKKIVIITTGSGIGPCLGVIQDLSDTLVRLGWSVRSPWETYGEENCKAVLRVDRYAAIIDTNMRIQGHPDIALLAYQEYLATSAEAVFVISNQRVTEDAVKRLRAGGIYAFGPVFDS